VTHELSEASSVEVKSMDENHADSGMNEERDEMFLQLEEDNITENLNDPVQSTVAMTASTENDLEFIHADPSEGVLDNPLMYVDGWKKHLTFVFAHASHTVFDRAGTYTHEADHATLVKRRGASDEDVQTAVTLANHDLQIELEKDKGQGLEEAELIVKDASIHAREHAAHRSASDEHDAKEPRDDDADDKKTGLAGDDKKTEVEEILEESESHELTKGNAEIARKRKDISGDAKIHDEDDERLSKKLEESSAPHDIARNEEFSVDEAQEEVLTKVAPKRHEVLEISKDVQHMELEVHRRGRIARRRDSRRNHAGSRRHAKMKNRHNRVD